MSSALTQAGLPATPAASPGRNHGGARLADLAWLTWRQHRAAIIAGLVLAAVVTAGLLYLAARITTINTECGNTECPTGAAAAAPLFGPFGLAGLSGDLALAVMLMPLLAGVFLGVPLLAREHEQRTLLLAWSQDITPQRWLWTKLAILGGLTAAAGAAMSAAVAHLAHVASIATGLDLFSGLAFLVTGWLPLVQSLAWLAVGVALGAAYRRTLPAIFTTLAGYAAAYYLVQWLYPTFRAPLTGLVPIGNNQSSPPGLGSNILVIQSGSGTIYDAAGHPVSPATIVSLCSSGSGKLLSAPCLVQHHFMSLLRYQPGSRIPEFHLILAGGYLALGAVAVGVVWLLARRTSLSAG
ncbi:MAG TPA: hypothetical protein VMU95_12140 [Trebonia sp.]|nr:hypothetical protein [Trebonia sp.]